MTFCELIHLVPIFLLFLFQDFQLNLPSFRKLLLYLREAIIVFQLVLKILIISCALDSLYYILAKTAKINEAIATAILEFVAKVMDNKNKNLQHHTVNLLQNSKLL